MSNVRELTPRTPNLVTWVKQFYAGPNYRRILVKIYDDSLQDYIAIPLEIEECKVGSHGYETVVRIARERGVEYAVLEHGGVLVVSIR